MLKYGNRFSNFKHFCISGMNLTEKGELPSRLSCLLHLTFGKVNQLQAVLFPEIETGYALRLWLVPLILDSNDMPYYKAGDLASQTAAPGIK